MAKIIETIKAWLEAIFGWGTRLPEPDEPLSHKEKEVLERAKIIVEETETVIAEEKKGAGETDEISPENTTLIEEPKMNIKQNFLSLGKKARSGQKFSKTVDTIVIHFIGPWSGKNRVNGSRSWWENGSDGKGVQASAHFIMCDDEVLQCLPLNEVGWHSGDSRNYNSIGIEVVGQKATAEQLKNMTGGADSLGEFSQLTKETLKKLIKHIQKEIPTAKKLERHYDGTQKKGCPLFYTPVEKIVDGKMTVINDKGGDERWKELKEFLEK